MKRPQPPTSWFQLAASRWSNSAARHSLAWDDARDFAATLDSGRSTTAFLADRFDAHRDAWERAAEEEDPAGLFLVGSCLTVDIGATDARQQGVELVQDAASGGFPPALHQLGRLLQNGVEASALGLDPDAAGAIALYRRAAESGFAPSMCNLGVAYLEGDGLRASFTQGIDWLRRAADLGNAVAQINLGACYADGEVVSEDPVLAAAYYGQAAAQDHPGALCLLGMCHEDGVGVAQNHQSAFECYSRAAALGDVEAQLLLGYCYQAGRGVARNESEAVRWYTSAAEAGNHHAQVALGSCFRHGDGVARDDEQAVKWFGLAAESGDPEACYQLATCYTRGHGAPQDHAAAVALYQSAQAHDHPDATYSLGVAYSRGDGVEPDLERAFEFFDRAAALGSQAAIQAMRMRTSTDDPSAALSELLASVEDPEICFDQVKAMACGVMQAAAAADPGELDGLLLRLLPTLDIDGPDRAGVAAIVCGALVENGADSDLVLGTVFDRLPQVLNLADRYLTLVKRRVDHLGLSGGLDPTLPFDDFDLPDAVTAWAAEQDGAAARAWHALDLWCQPAIAMLSRNGDARHDLPRNQLDPVIARLRHESRAVAFLAHLLDVIEETVVVIHPASERGFEVALSGVSDNFQLQTLLGAVLIDAGLAGEPPSADAVAVAKGEGPQEIEANATAHWEFFQWSALKADLTLPTVTDLELGYVPLDAQPSDFERLDERRVILLGDAPFPRCWNVCRTFASLEASVRIEGELDAGEVAAMLRKMACART